MVLLRRTGTAVRLWSGCQWDRLRTGRFARRRHRLGDGGALHLTGDDSDRTLAHASCPGPRRELNTAAAYIILSQIKFGGVWGGGSTDWGLVKLPVYWSNCSGTGQGPLGDAAPQPTCVRSLSTPTCACAPPVRACFVGDAKPPTPQSAECGAPSPPAQPPPRAPLGGCSVWNLLYTHLQAATPPICRLQHHPWSLGFRGLGLGLPALPRVVRPRPLHPPLHSPAG